MHTSRLIPMLLPILAVGLALPGCSGGGDAPSATDTGDGSVDLTPFAAKLTASDAAEAGHFGFSIALQGDTLAVGAIGGTPCAVDVEDPGACIRAGAAYVRERDGGDAGAWGEVAKLSGVDIGPLPAEGDLFGFAAAIDGDTLAIGAPRAGAAGAVWIFARDADDPLVWDPVQAIEGIADDDAFGFSVALDGDTLVVGAPGSGAAGAVSIFERSPGPPPTWNEIQTLVGASAGDAFGSALAIDGDRIAVGAPQDIEGCPGDPGLPCAPGATHVLARCVVAACVDAWETRAVLVPAGGAPGDRFGAALAMDGPTLVVGAPRADDRCPNTWPECDAGRGHVYERDAGGPDAWGPVALLRVDDPDPLGELGASVAISGDTLVLGASGDDEAAVDAGAVHIYARSGETWVHSDKIIPEDAEARDRFGASVAVDAGTLAVGAYREDEACPPDPECTVDCEIPPRCNPGAAYLFDLE
jgi:hypothetical protein